MIRFLLSFCLLSISPLLARDLVDSTPSASLSATSHAEGRQGVVATVHPRASEIALNVLKDGGNAIDAAVAAGLALGVVDGFNSGIGGGCFLLIHTADGNVVALDGRETAPAAAHRDMFLRDGQADPDLSRKGPLAVGVPGALAAYAHALEHHGSKSLAEVVAPSIELARQGFVLGPDYLSRLRGAVDKLREFPGASAIFLTDAHAWPEGHRLIQDDLAKTYEGIARQGIDYFYRGPVARAVAAWMKTHGGILTEDDFAAYQPRFRTPIRSSYRGHEVIGFPPPSSGGVHVAQMLNILETFPVAEMTDLQRAHVLAETMKLAFADRAFWLGDPEHSKVPRGLIDPEYGRDLARRISLEDTLDVPAHSQPPAADTDWFDGHTTHFCVADAAGNWVACTQTVNTTYGSGIVVPGTGVVLNNEMDDFSAQPGTPNAFGLLGAEANAVAPGKRPLSSMSPTLVLRDGQPVFSVGAAGGPTIITQVLQALVRRLDLELSLTECLAQPRLHHQWRPDRLLMEERFDDALRQALETRGHPVTVTNTIGVSQAIARSQDGLLSAQSDPRIQGSALGF